MEQVQGRRDERQRQQREPQNANGDVQQGPTAPTHDGPRLGPEPDQQSERDEARRQGPVNSATAEARNTRSLTTWSSTRKSARMESTGATPTGVSCVTPTTCTAAPAR